jgi:hypothetical protein
VKTAFVESTAVQADAAKHETELRSTPGSTTTGADQCPLTYSRQSPMAFIAMQNDELGQETALISLLVSANSALQGRDSEDLAGIIDGVTRLACSLRDLLASDVLRDDRRRRTTTGPCEVRR